MNNKFLSPLESFDFSHPYSQFLASVAASQTAQIALSEALRPNLETKKRLEAILPEQTHYLQSYMPALAELQNRLSQLTEQEFQRVQDEFEPSDELVKALNSTLQNAVDISDKTADTSHLLLNKSFVKENLVGIISILLSIIFYFAPNAEQQTIISQNKQIIEQKQKTIELDERRNELLQDFANTIHLLVDDIDMVRNALDSQQQSVDGTVHSPAQDQNVDFQQENND